MDPCWFPFINDCQAAHYSSSNMAGSICLLDITSLQIGSGSGDMIFDVKCLLF